MILGACNGGSDAPDVSDEKIALSTRRLDLDLAKVDTGHIAADLQALKTKYPDFLDFWLDDLLQYGVNGNYSGTSQAVRENLHLFFTNKDFRSLFDTVAKHFPDTRAIDEPLRKGFQYYQHYYPGAGIPKVVYFVSMLSNWAAVMPDTSVVGIGLDMLLGKDFPPYRASNLHFADYEIRNFRPDVAPVAVFRVMYQRRHPFVSQERNLLDMMVQRGKEQYFLSKIIPFVPDSTRLFFTGAQTKWCAENESLIYNYFVRASTLYDTNPERTMRYIMDGPSASGMPPESPGNVGTWLGWQIVKAYAVKHPKMTLEEVLQVPDAQAMLQESGYKPR